jgi:hypothetical protein
MIAGTTRGCPRATHADLFLLPVIVIHNVPRTIGVESLSRIVVPSQLRVAIINAMISCLQPVSGPDLSHHALVPEYLHTPLEYARGARSHRTRGT